MGLFYESSPIQFSVDLISEEVKYEPAIPVQEQVVEILPSKPKPASPERIPLLKAATQSKLSGFEDNQKIIEASTVPVSTPIHMLTVLPELPKHPNHIAAVSSIFASSMNIPIYTYNQNRRTTVRFTINEETSTQQLAQISSEAQGSGYLLYLRCRSEEAVGP